MKETGLLLLTSVISIISPALALSFALRGDPNVPSLSVLLPVSVAYVTVLYALVGGFEWSQEPLPNWRSLLFLFLGGLGLALLLGIGWLCVRFLLARVFRVQKLKTHFRPL